MANLNIILSENVNQTVFTRNKQLGIVYCKSKLNYPYYFHCLHRRCIKALCVEAFMNHEKLSICGGIYLKDNQLRHPH